MKGRIILNQQRDLPMLMYIWKWKIATTASLHHKFYSNLKDRNGYFRLNMLKKHGYLVTRTDRFGQRPAWMLTKKGFEVIQEDLPDLKEAGYQSENLWHDLMCSALHQGDFFLEQPENVILVSEQQLRRFRNETLPDWVPSPELHRPDGYIYIRGGKKPMTISLELEKSRKSTAKLVKLANFYSDFDSSSRVLWVLDGRGLVERIQSCTKMANWELDIHNIVFLKDFLNLGWQSPIISGPEMNQTIQQFINSKAITNPSQTNHARNHRIILDNRLCYPNNSKTHETLKPAKSATV